MKKLDPKTNNLFLRESIIVGRCKGSKRPLAMHYAGDYRRIPTEHRSFCSAVKVLYFINIFCNFQQFKGYLQFVGELQQTDHPRKFASIVYCFIVESDKSRRFEETRVRLNEFIIKITTMTYLLIN